MESALALTGLFLLAVVLAAILGFVAWLRTGDMRRRIEHLEKDLGSLRAALEAASKRNAEQRARAAEKEARDGTRRDETADQAAPEAPTASEAEPGGEPSGEDDTPDERDAEQTGAGETGAGETGTGDIGAEQPPAAGPSRPATPVDIARGRVPSMAASTHTEETVSAPPRPIRKSSDSSFELRFGANWPVWIGGLALVLGGIFLVRYSIETGLLTPALRVLAGGVFAAILIGLGEISRRRMPDDPQTGSDTARSYIPGVLTLAGITTAFGSAYAAHALYGLIGPAAAFVLLGCVSFAALAASLLHGPAMASIGLVASYGVPFLVSSQEPTLAPLVLYGLFVALAAYAVARVRRWRWLAVAGSAGAIFWAHILSFLAEPADAGLLAAYDIVALALAAFFFVVSLRTRSAGSSERPDWMVSAILAAHALPVLYLLQIDTFGTVSVATLVLILAGLLALASEWPAVAAGAIAAAVLGALAHLTFDVPLAPSSFAPGMASDPVIAAALLNPATQAFLHFGLGIGVLLAAAGLVGTWRSAGRWALAAAGTAGPLALFGIAYLRTETVGLETTFGLMALALAAAFAAVTAFFETRLDRSAPTRDLAVSAYAIATIAAIIAGMAILLQQGWLVIGLALLTTGIAWVETRKPSPVLRWLAVAAAACCCLAVADDPTIAGPALGTTPVFNWLLYGYGLPALAFAATALLMARSARDLPQEIFEALTVVFALATVAMLIHHGMNGGDMYAEGDTLAERGLYTLLALSASVGLQMLQGRAGGRIFDVGSMLLGLASFAAIAIAHLVVLNPIATGEPIGDGVLFNVLLPAYLLPALLLAALARLSQDRRPPAYTLIAGVLALAMLFAWLSLEVRAVFHRPRLDLGDVTDAELYTYSVVWLALGIALLFAGVISGSRAVRLASAAVVALVVVKVFLIDMDSLTGIWRALSFIGLGFVLIGIGALYQRLLKGSRKQDVGEDGGGEEEAET